MKIPGKAKIKYLKSIFSMIPIIPSLHIGSRGYHYLFPRKANVLLYITNLCNSRCVLCNHWKQDPKYNLSPEKISELLNCHSIRKNSFVICGGEGILHPGFDEIMRIFKGRDFSLFSNGLATETLLKNIDKYRIPEVAISLEGDRQAYMRVRGLDKYNDILKTIDLIKDKTNLSVCFTITPWNTYEDFLHVQKICNSKNVRLLLNIFSKMDFMGVQQDEDLIDQRFDQINNSYVNNYNLWVKGKINIPCFSMRFLAVVRPNGDVMLCQYKNIKLGNLYERSFDQIWNDKNTKMIQKSHKNCNDCWVSSHRAFDIMLASILGKVCRKSR